MLRAGSAASWSPSRPRPSVGCAAHQVRTNLANRPLHKLPDGRLLCPVIGPQDDASLPFAVALELSTSQHPSTPSPPPSPPVDSSTYALAYILEGRGQFTIPDDASTSSAVHDIQAGDTVLAPTDIGSYSSALPDSDTATTTNPLGSLARLLLILPNEVFAPASEQPPDAHTQSYQSVIETWQQWQACPTAGSLTADDVHTLLSRRQPSELLPSHTGDVSPRVSTAPHSPLPSLGEWHSAMTASGRALLRGLHAVLTQQRTPPGPLVIKRAFDDVEAFQLPNQSNVLAMVFDPVQHPMVPFTFGVEIFQASHKTPPHVHNAHEVFFVLSGNGEAFCDGVRFAVGEGDLLLFPPHSVHGVDVSDDNKMYCLEFMLPNDMFAEYVHNGISTGGLHDDDLCQLNVIAC